MRLIRGAAGLRHKFKKPVVTIGIFDGVHLAHQRIIKDVIRQAKRIRGTSVVLTFEPHPLKTFYGHTAVPLITSLKHRLDLFRRLNLDVCLLLDFDKKFAECSPERFVKHILVETIGVNCLIVGKTFHFGKARQGSFSLLKKLSKRYKFKVKGAKPIKIGAKIVSSSRIRMLIQSGRIRQANRLLGRLFSISGKVTKGENWGAALGYPTANIEPRQEVIPSCGVYAVFIKLNNKLYSGVLNIGSRPTLSPKEGSLRTIEVHLFNFRNNIYGRELEVFFVLRLRPEKKFITRQALVSRINKDAIKAKRLLQAEALPQI